VNHAAFVGGFQAVGDLEGEGPRLNQVYHRAFLAGLCIGCKRREPMKFMSTWTVRPGKMSEVIAKFLATGAPGPAGIKVTGRWHKADMSGGWTLSEGTDPSALYESSAEWADLIEIHGSVVIEDADAGAVLGKLFKK
jgi:hypothetical protein